MPAVLLEIVSMAYEENGKKRATASPESLRKIFTLPEYEDSTLIRIEQDLSRNINEFLNAHIVATDRSMEDIEKDFLDTTLPEDPTFVSQHAQFLRDKVLAHSVHTSSPSFIGHMTSALPYFMLPLSKIVTALNQNLVKVETSKAFTPLERQVLGILHRIVFSAGDDEHYRSIVQDRSVSLGVFCSGGTTANITALWVARNQLLAPRNAFQGVQKSGMAAALREYGIGDLKVFVSERGHYSLRKAADVLGLGIDGVVSIPTTSNGKVDVLAMREAIQRAKMNGDGCVAIVGIAGTTETGKVDPLNDLADLAEQEKIFYHVDAAWGGPVLMSNNSRHLLAGIERADSVTFDAHKQLYVPMGAGIVLFRDPNAASSIAHFANYIIRKGSRDLGRRSLEGSRPGMALLVHAALTVIGRRGYELLIDDGIAKARAFADLIRQQPDFEILSDPELNILTYRYYPQEYRSYVQSLSGTSREEALERLNVMTKKMQSIQRGRGKSFVSRTQLSFSQYGNIPIAVFRVVLANPLTTLDTLKEILVEQRAIGESKEIRSLFRYGNSFGMRSQRHDE